MQQETIHSSSSQSEPLRLSGVRGHETDAPLWEMVCLTRQGLAHNEIGSRLGRHFVTVRDDLFARGIVGRPSYHDFGEPVTASKVAELRRRTGLYIEELASMTGISSRDLKAAIRVSPRPGGNDHWHGDRRIAPVTTEKIIALRDRLLRSFSGQIRGGARIRAWQTSAIVKTLIPDLPDSFQALRRVLRDMRKYLRANPAAGTESLKDYVCERAWNFRRGSNRPRRPVDSVAANDATTFLLWAPDLLPALEANLARIRSKGDVAPIAQGIIGERWGITPRVISQAMRAGTRVISPKEMRLLILGNQTLRGSTLRADPVTRSIVPAATKPRKKRDRKDRTKLRGLMVKRAVQEELPRAIRGIERLRSLRREFPGSPADWQSTLRREGFSGPEISALLGADTAIGVAQRVIVASTGLSLPTVQTYWSRPAPPSPKV